MTYRCGSGECSSGSELEGAVFLQRIGQQPHTQLRMHMKAHTHAHTCTCTLQRAT